MILVFCEVVFFEQFNMFSCNIVIELLGIVFSVVGDDWLQVIMLVDECICQFYGILYGGVLVVLVEILGSSVGNLCVDIVKQICVGLEINVNYVCVVCLGIVIGIVCVLYVGCSIQLWEICIEDEQGCLVCILWLILVVVVVGYG